MLSRVFLSRFACGHGLTERFFNLINTELRLNAGLKANDDKTDEVTDHIKLPILENQPGGRTQVFRKSPGIAGQAGPEDIAQSSSAEY